MMRNALLLSSAVLAVSIGACSETLATDPNPIPAVTDTVVPVLDRIVFVRGLSNPWDVAFLPNGELLITERPGLLRLRRTTGDLITVAQPTDVVQGSEGGMMGMALDPQFASNRYVYICMSSNLGSNTDNRVVRWTLAARDGAAAPGNPVIAGADARIYTYGHRNVQGIAFRPSTGATYATEQGPAFDDEVNVLVAVANAGWNPVPAYNESVSMTDLTKYPNALKAVWSSGSPARGTCGGGFISGAAWRAWDGALVLGQLSGTRLMVLTFNTNGTVRKETPAYGELGLRLRTPLQGPDGALYVTTDVSNGGGEIWRIAPRP